jgi:hypothetical protein
MSQATSLKSN